MKYILLLTLALLFVHCSSESTLTVIDPKDDTAYKAEIKKHRVKIRQCYLNYSTEKTKVDLTVTLIVDPDGNVTKMDFLSNHNMNDDLKDCLVDIVEHMDIRKPVNGGTIEVKTHLNFNLDKKNKRYY